MFETKAPWIMNLLRADFNLSIEEAAAVLGNLGHESGGFVYYQEIKPTVPGSRGGAGWPQWTGPRRVAFEAYCKRNGLDPKSDRANYGYLFVELTDTEKAAIPAVKAASGLEAKVRAFEAKFERAGVKHYDSRYAYAKRALAAHAANPHAKAPYMATPPTPPIEVVGLEPYVKIPPVVVPANPPVVPYDPNLPDGAVISTPPYADDDTGEIPTAIKWGTVAVGVIGLAIILFAALT